MREDPDFPQLAPSPDYPPWSTEDDRRIIQPESEHGLNVPSVQQDDDFVEGTQTPRVGEKFAATDGDTSMLVTMYSFPPRHYDSKKDTAIRRQADIERLHGPEQKDPETLVEMIKHQNPYAENLLSGVVDHGSMELASATLNDYEKRMKIEC